MEKRTWPLSPNRGTYRNGIDGVGPMALKDGKVDITGMTPVTLVDGLDGFNHIG
jgi:hypothetical protein